MHESEHTVLANRFRAKESWSGANSERNRVKARPGDLPMAALCLLAFCALPSPNRAQVPVYEVTPVESTIKFDVGSSTPIRGTFDNWNASMKFSSTDVRSGVLDIEIQADSVDTGSGLKNGKLKGKDFFYAVSVSPDSQLVAAGGEEGIVYVYNGANGQLLRTLQVPEKK